MWNWVLLGSIAVGGAAGICGFTLLVLDGRKAWRTLQDVRRHAADSLGELAAKSELTAEKAAAAGDTAELRESVARLRTSIAQLNVLRAALEEAEGRAGWLTLLLRFV